ncbi:MAG: mechanosensitive ion channel, partial [Planctomycetaceae bacterium]|nr:mechanosensitive ion channel [Planctomycetaceae bacterium]
MSLDQLYQKAIDDLQSAEQTDRVIAALAQELEAAPQLVNELQEKLSKPPAADTPDAGINSADVDVLNAKLKEAETQSAAVRQRQQEIKAEIERRNARRPQLADLRSQGEQQLQQATQELSASSPADEHPRVRAVRQMRLQTKQHRLTRELVLLDQELRTYEGTARCRSLQLDMADRELRDSDRKVQVFQKLLSDAQRRKADAEARQARQALARSHVSVRAEARRNTDVADENAQLIQSLRESQIKLDDVNKDLQTRVQEYEATKGRAEAAEFSAAVGVLLRSRQSALPDLRDVRLEIAARQAAISDLNLHLMEWEAERKSLLDLPEATADAIDSLGPVSESITRQDLEEQVQSLLAARFKMLDDLLAVARQHLDVLVRIDSQQKKFVALVDEEAQWLAEHVLWVRSTGIIGTQPRMFLNSVSALLDRRAWLSSGRVVLLNVSENWGVWLAGLLGPLFLLVVRGRSKRKIRSLGEAAERATCVDILPTVEAILLLLLVAAPGPLVVLLLGLRIASIARGDDLLQAAGSGLQAVAAVWAIIEIVRHVAQSHSLAHSHFGWPRPVLAALRRTSRFLSAVLLPSVFIIAFTDELGDGEIVASVGRAAFLACMLCFGWSILRWLRPSSPMLQALQTTDAGGLLYRLRGLWVTLFLVLPVALAALSAAGFHYTAVQFTGRAAATVCSGIAILLTTAFLHRWLLLTYRKLAIRRGRERRELLLQAAQNDSEQPLPAEATPELTLVDINAQSRRMLRLAAGMGSTIALYLIWIDVLPALGFLRELTLWPDGQALPSDDGAAAMVTAADLLLALLIGAFTVFASRNLPGIMEIAILQRLPLDAGARYAATTVSRYVIVVTGVVLGFRTIGVGWSSVQWLVAAMTVGLGFGLQEIFANFVSGIIVLFERPMRVGDMVTIGGSSGTVTRIQIRATTILDWDYKELIVPNREFVTGNLVNWTLSSPTLRAVIKIGVAYGSDPRAVTELLLRAAAENPVVLSEPPPFAILNSFGAYALEFELRVHVSGLRNLGRAYHELNIAVDELFKEHDIEIAGPRQDVYVRSVPEDLVKQLTGNSVPGRIQKQGGL